MTHDELLQKINDRLNECTIHDFAPANFAVALRKIVELHRPEEQEHGQYEKCWNCSLVYPCPTINAIEKELK